MDRVSLAARAIVTKAFEGSVPIGPIIRPWKTYLPPPVKSRDALRLYQTNPWVHAIVSKVSTKCAGVTWYLDDNGKRIDDHPMLSFLNSGSEYMTGLQSRSVTFAHTDLCGESFWLIGRDESGAPASYLPCPPHWMIDVANGPGQNFIMQAERGRYFEIAYEDVLWFKNPDPLDPTARGSSLTRAAWREFEIDDTIREFTYNFIKNDARPSLIITGTETRNIEAIDVARLEATWMPKFKGEKNANKPLFSGVPLNVKEFGFSPRDGQMIENREHSANVISQIYSIPPEMLGRIENSNRSTIDGAEDLLARFTLLPRLELMRDVLQHRLMSEFDSAMLIDRKGRLTPTPPLKLLYDTPVPADKAYNLSVMKSAPTAFKVDEWRKAAGQQPIGPGEGGDEMYTPHITSAFGQSDDTNDESVAADDTSSKPKKKPKKKPKDGEDEGDDSSKSLKRALLKAFDINDVAEISSSHEDGSVKSELQSIFGPVYDALVAKFGEAVLMDIGSALQFEESARLRGWAATATANLIKNIDETTRKELRDLLIEQIDAGASVDTIAEAITDAFNGFEDVRAALIATTEATRASGFASFEAAKQAGMSQKEWLTVNDNKVREAHDELEGKIVGIDEAFMVDGESAMYPGDFGVAALDCNCRCAIIPIVPGEIDPATGEAPVSASAVPSVTKAADMAARKAAHLERLKAAEPIMKAAAVKAFRVQQRAVLRALRGKV